MAQEWREILKEDIVLPSGKVLSLGRARTHKDKRLYIDDKPTYRFSYDGQVGASMHYLDAESAWQDVDENAEEPDGDGFTVKFTKLSYFGRIDNEGRRRFYPDRNDLSYWIEFKKPYLNMGIPTRHNRWFYWDFAHAIIGVRFDVDSLKFGFRLKDDQAPTSITIPFETQGITRQGRLLLHNGEVVAELRKPIGTGSNLDAEGMPVQKECDVVFGPGEVTISLDPTGLEYPIEIDPTIDKQVGASGDDGALHTGTIGFKVNDTYLYMGWGVNPAYLHVHGFARWIGVTYEGTVDVSYTECYAQGAGYNTPEHKVYGVDEDNPPAPTSAAEFNADPLTDAAVDWDGAWPEAAWAQSPSLNPIFQELVDTYTISNAAVMVQIKNDHGTPGTSEYNKPCMWDYAGNLHGPKLHIEYTAGGGEFPYSGNIPLVAMPSYLSALDKGYEGQIALSALPSYLSSLHRLYDGQVPLALMPTYLSSAEKGYDGAVGISIVPSYALIIDRVYDGQISVLIVPSAIYSLIGVEEYIYSGQIPLEVLPSYLSIVDRLYDGQLQLLLLPSSVALGYVPVVEPIRGVLRASDIFKGTLIDKDKTRGGLTTGRPKGVIK